MPAANRVHVDQPLANIITAKVPIASTIGLEVLKPVAVRKQTDLIRAYTDGTFFTTAAASGKRLFLRAPGTPPDYIDYDTTATDSYACENYELGAVVTDEEAANADSPLTPRQTKAQMILQQLLAAMDQRHAALLFDTATTFASYTSTPSAKWDADEADPWADRTTAVESMMSNGTYDPNTCDLVFVTGIQSWHRFSRNPVIVDLIKRTQAALNIGIEQWRQFLEVDKFLIGSSTYNTAKDGQTPSLGYVWGKYGGFYSVPKGMTAIGQPMVGMTPIWTAGNGGGLPYGYATQRWYEKEIRGEKITGGHYTDEVVLQASAGFVFSALTS